MTIFMKRQVQKIALKFTKNWQIKVKFRVQKNKCPKGHYNVLYDNQEGLKAQYKKKNAPRGITTA